MQTEETQLLEDKPEDSSKAICLVTKTSQSESIVGNNEDGSVSQKLEVLPEVAVNKYVCEFEQVGGNENNIKQSVFEEKPFMENNLLNNMYADNFESIRKGTQPASIQSPEKSKFQRSPQKVFVFNGI